MMVFGYCQNRPESGMPISLTWRWLFPCDETNTFVCHVLIITPNISIFSRLALTEITGHLMAFLDDLESWNFWAWIKYVNCILHSWALGLLGSWTPRLSHSANTDNGVDIPILHYDVLDLFAMVGNNSKQDTLQKLFFFCFFSFDYLKIDKFSRNGTEANAAGPHTHTHTEDEWVSERDREWETDWLTGWAGLAETDRLGKLAADWVAAS